MRRVGAGLVKAEGLIETLTCFVIVIHIEHCLLDGLFFEVDKAFRTDCFTDSFTCFIGVNADDIELADGVLVNKVAMDLGPAEACNLAIVNA